MFAVDLFRSSCVTSTCTPATHARVWLVCVCASACERAHAHARVRRPNRESVHARNAGPIARMRPTTTHHGHIVAGGRGDLGNAVAHKPAAEDGHILELLGAGRRKVAAPAPQTGSARVSSRSHIARTRRRGPAPMNPNASSALPASAARASRQTRLGRDNATATSRAWRALTRR